VRDFGLTRLQISVDWPGFETGGSISTNAGKLPSIMFAIRRGVRRD
jgi:hypothetical protein